MKKEIPIYQVDAFHNEMFKGNPAAVCPLEEWIPDETMQSIAEENNLSETAFFVDEGDRFRIRWFTPKSEVDLCGHATLATAHVLFNHLSYEYPQINFDSAGGELSVSRDEKGMIQLNFPALKPEHIDNLEEYETAFGIKPEAVYRSNKLMLVFDAEEKVLSLNPDFARIVYLDPVGVIVTAKGKEFDFVSRFFAPGVGIPEDPVTGSAHSIMIPYWSDKLGKKKMTAFQASKRGGIIYCEDQGERVLIGGQAVTYMTGTIRL